MSAQEVEHAAGHDAIVVDAREPEVFAAGHVPGSSEGLRGGALPRWLAGLGSRPGRRGRPLRTNRDASCRLRVLARGDAAGHAQAWGQVGTMSTPTPGEGARRSRRGYYFEDLCAPRHCMAMADGRWIAVTSDGDEDITSASDALLDAGRDYQPRLHSSTMP